ncbi:MAG: Ig-like domain-containing protein [Candidatus Rifleibacteriota bacterium]
MKRLNVLFFALLIIFNFYTIEVAKADFEMINVQVSLQNDADANGYVNQGDTIRCRCNAVVDPGDSPDGWQVPPTVDLSNIGMSSVTMNDQGGDTYQVDVVLNNWNQNINYQSEIITFYAISANDLVLREYDVSVVFDLCQVEGTGASASPNNAGIGSTLFIEITDNKYQSDPSGGTVATVNLEPIGLNATTPLTYQGAGVFSVTTDPIPEGINYTGPLTITLNDPMIGHPAIGYQTNNINVDTAGPDVDFNATTVVIQSGNATAIPGDVLRITAGVNTYDNETVTVSNADLDAVAANPPLAGGLAMPLISSSGIGNPATWQVDVTLSEDDLKNTSLPITFTFEDDMGNVSTVTRYVPIDLDKPNMVDSSVNIMLPDGAYSSLDVATTSCTLEMVSTITVDVGPDPLTVTIDLSPIGGASDQPMSQFGLSDQYKATYLIGQGAIEDGAQHTFVVSARDDAGNLVAQATTPVIRIDNNPPVISGASLSSDDAYIGVDDTFTIECTATGVENGSVTVDLSTIGLSHIANLPNVGGNTYRSSFILPDSRDPGVPGVVDELKGFKISVNDTVYPGDVTGHIEEADTNMMMVDNEPPTILDTRSVYSHNYNTSVDDGFVRIGDSLSFHARVASDPISVKINMAALGQSNAETMIASAAPSDGLDGWYDYNLYGGVATGTFNQAVGVPFTVTLKDDANNATTTQILIDIDNKPVEINGFEVNVSYKPGRSDPDPSIINLNKTLDIRVPFNIPIPVDNATGTIDLSEIGGSSAALMNVSNGSYSISIDTSESSFDSAGHKFRAVIADEAGNLSVANSSVYQVDCQPPAILNATVEQTSGGAVAIVGDTLKFRAEVENNESVLPTVDLSDIGGNSEQELASAGGGWYEYIATIQNGNLDEVTNASWTITAWDDDYNYATASTNIISVDNYGPDLVDGLDLEINGSSVTTLSTIKIGDVLDFTLDINNTVGTGPAVIDLRAVGGAASQTMVYNNATSAYSLNFTAGVATDEYTDYKFVAYVDDENANRVTTQSPNVPVVDCQPITFSNSDIGIYEDNGDNPVSGIANIGDEIIVYTTALNYADAVASATIGSGTSDFESAVMTFNSSTNRHEAVFTVKEPGVDGWGTLTGSTSKLYFKLTGLDDIGNLTETGRATSSFTLRNVNPEIDYSNTGFALDPNSYLETAGGYKVFNLASDTVGDRLIASITFADSLPIHRAWLDFSELGTGTVEMIESGAKAETSAAGVAVSDLPELNYVKKTVYMYAQDEAGNISSASETFWIDNVAPSLTKATFDGETIQVSLSETYSNLVYKNFELVGSNPPPLNTPVYLDFTTASPTVLEDLTSFEMKLNHDHQKEVAQWASTPVYLKVTDTNVATAPLTDLSGNWLPNVDYYPVTITDSLWREPAQITQFTVTQNWPASVTLDIFFNKDMDKISVVASDAVFLTSPITYDFTGIDYTTGYVLQPEDVATISWPLDNHMRISLSEDGRDWVARKLGNGSTKLYFANRSAGHTFAYDSLGKPMDNVPTSAPIEAVDNRPTPSFDFYGPPNAPFLNLASKTLILTANDRLLLSHSDFDVNDSLLPDMGMPEPTNNNRVTDFFNKAVLHDIDNGTSRTLELQGLDISINDEFASSTVTLHLTDDDFKNILDMFEANHAPLWRMAIGAGAFTNLWNTPSTAYLPSGNPGAIKLATPTVYTAVTFAACSMNDKPPVNQKNSGDLLFDIEVYPPDFDGVSIPLQYQVEPKVSIVNQNDGSLISSGTFVSYSERTVDGKLRSMFRFSNTSDFPTNLQRVPAEIEVNDITDIFGNTYSVTASYAYDLNTRNDSLPEGYSDTASAPIEIDTQKPVVSTIIPSDVIGESPAGSAFKVLFDEEMDTAFTPVLSLATDSRTIGFTFTGWTATATANFTSNSAFTPSLPNGLWYYEVTGGQDISGNAHAGTAENAFPVQVRTYAPEVSVGNITLRATQPNISATNYVVDQPWASQLSDGIFSITYDNPPTQFLPHYLEIFDPSDDTRLGRVEITVDDVTGLATATFSDSDFYAAPVYPGDTGPTTYFTRIVDSAMNQTASISSLVYDNLSPDLATFTLSGIGSETADTWYYRPTSGNFTANVVTTSTTDKLRLGLYSDATGATTTISLNPGALPGEYNVQTGSSLTDGDYKLTVLDLAGNMGTGLASRKLVVDSTQPAVTAIYPDDIVGNCPFGGTEFRVVFSEKMDADPAYTPVLELATSATSISLQFDSWADPDIATTAIYTNAEPVVSTMPAGIYDYSVTGGVDLAHNNLSEPAAGSFKVEVQSEGPFARIDNYTLQPHIYNSAQKNIAFNPDYGGGSATLRIDYSGGPFNTPHDLRVYNSSDNQVATYSGLPSGDPIEIQLYDSDVGSWTWATGPSDGTYRFRIADSLGNISGSSLPEAFKFDTASPSMSSFNMESYGIATDTGAGLVWYYSPEYGAATFTITTYGNDEVRLLVTNTTNATYTKDMSGTGTYHQCQYGDSLADGIYAVSVVDLAGNFDIGSFTPLMVESTRPTVSSVNPILAGGVKAGEGIFELTFNEHMNTNVAPTANLASDAAVIPLTFVSWLSTDTVRFTNTNDLDVYPTATYSYHISGARDLAGNLNEDPATGSFEIQMFTTPPSVTATLRSQQHLLTGLTELFDQPYSPDVPGVASLSIRYQQGPYQVPHSLLVYNSSNVQVATLTINPDVANQTATATVNAWFFGSPGNNGPLNYSFRLMDSIGNLSATSTTTIVYDALEPEIGTGTITNVSDASSDPLYYNEQLHGDLQVVYETNTADPLRMLLLNGVATYSYDMTVDPLTDIHNVAVSQASASTLAEGAYVLTAADMAGNFAIGDASYTPLIVDRTPPSVDSVVADEEPLPTSEAGGATFTVTFNESMSELGSQEPSLSLATESKTISCSFESWINSTQARFVTAEAIEPDIPQGIYNCSVTGWDLTGNKVATSTADTMEIRSRGPVIDEIYAQSYQSTTASDSSEILTDKPFSFNVEPGTATLTIKLAQAPDSLPIHLHFMQSNSTVASFTLADGVDFDSATNAATFTWSAANGPNPSAPTTYQVKLVDDAGDFSLESYNWTMDASAPVVLSEPVITRGVVATSAVYFNPDLHDYINVRFNSAETEAPRLRIRGANSTDTYNLTSSGTGRWSCNFEGRYSRGSDPKSYMPDGTYNLDMVDSAGNVSVLASGSPIVYDVVIDTDRPGIASYNILLNGNPVTSFSPSAGDLEIQVYSPETLDEQGIFQVEVLNSSNVRIRQLGLSNVGGIYTAYWDGKNKSGDMVNDGDYKLKAIDYTGNTATDSVSIFALTTDFTATGITQISSTSAKIWFNHEIDASSLASASITTAGLTVSNIAKAEAQAISFDVAPNFADQNYDFEIATGTVRSIYGATIDEPNNTLSLTADGTGPKLVEVNFEDLSGQQEFIVVFDETYSSTSAGNKSNYSLAGPDGAVGIAQVTTQSNKKTVLITAEENLIENADYEIAVDNIEDKYGNISPASNTLSFKGRDLTPPELEVSAFSNPANENDIIVVVVSNEELKSAPELQIAQSNAPLVTTSMQQGSNPLAYMIGVHLSSSYPGNGTLKATAEDLAGNQGSGSAEFAVAYLSANQVASIISADKLVSVDFSANSLTEDALVKIMAHRLEKDQNGSGRILNSLQVQARQTLGMRANTAEESHINQDELIVVSDAYEVSVASAKIKDGFHVFMKLKSATDTQGLGMFYQQNDNWKFVSSGLTREREYAAKVRKTQVFAIMRDVKAPEVSIDSDIDLNDPFRTARPEFRGRVSDAGSGIDLDSVTAHIDSGPAQLVEVDSSGGFVFRPMADLTGGRHTLEIRAADNTGNQSQMTPVRFEVSVPLKITQIIQYPNPARNRAYIRISANRGDIGTDLVKVKLYDVSGDKIRTVYGIRGVNERWGINARYLYDIPWDLCDSKGRKVANGVYFARIEIRDPDNPAKKVKETFKLAVLR